MTKILAATTFSSIMVNVLTVIVLILVVYFVWYTISGIRRAARQEPEPIELHLKLTQSDDESERSHYLLSASQ